MWGRLGGGGGRGEEVHLSGDGRHGKLQVPVGDVGLAEVEAAPAEELLADGGEGAVAAHDEVGLQRLRAAVGPALQPQQQHMGRGPQPALNTLCDISYRTIFLWGHRQTGDHMHTNPSQSIINQSHGCY